MTQYINKDAVVAEIERIKKKECPTDTYEGRCKLFWFQQFLSFLDTLEAKEVDLDESARHYLLHEHMSPLNVMLHQADYFEVEMQYHQDIEDAYKAGFELGLKAQK